MRHAISNIFNGLVLPGLVAMAAVAWSGVAFSEGLSTGGVMSEGDVNRGAATWANNCTRCHEMRSPTEFRDDIWKTIVAHMRLRGGLNGEQQRDILAFLQASNSPRAAKMSLEDSSPGTGLSGKDIYSQTCVACHGANGKGAIPGVPDFTRPTGPLSKPDEELLHNIINGYQGPGSQMAMPAKGGNPELNAADVRAVLEYLHESFGQ
ncbi:MAG: cytochrome c5 family protein [Thiohalobacterales bacterium]